jgi:hypothetical protein
MDSALQRRKRTEAAHSWSLSCAVTGRRKIGCLGGQGQRRREPWLGRHTRCGLGRILYGRWARQVDVSGEISSPEAKYCGLAGAFCKSRRLWILIFFDNLALGQFGSTSALIWARFACLPRSREAFVRPNIDPCQRQRKSSRGFGRNGCRGGIAGSFRAVAAPARARSRHSVSLSWRCVPELTLVVRRNART